MARIAPAEKAEEVGRHDCTTSDLANALELRQKKGGGPGTGPTAAASSCA